MAHSPFQMPNSWESHCLDSNGQAECLVTRLNRIMLDLSDLHHHLIGGFWGEVQNASCSGPFSESFCVSRFRSFYSFDWTGVLRYPIRIHTKRIDPSHENRSRTKYSEKSLVFSLRRRIKIVQLSNKCSNSFAVMSIQIIHSWDFLRPKGRLLV
jgi:hypothetical protein